MNTRAWSAVAAALLLSQSLITSARAATLFPDVPSTHTYRVQIEALAEIGVVKGNPDGTFSPQRTVNRAEFLTLLYRAAGKTPATPAVACFKDVGTAAWFSAVVCDALNSKYVAGYADGYFRPEQEVNRVEALKMIHTVLGLTLNADASLSPLKMYGDISLFAWYGPYMASAFDKGILPIEGQKGTLFTPEKALLRGEAAAYIYNALGLKAEMEASSSSSQASSVAVRSSVSSNATTKPVVVPLDVDFPFGDDGMFQGKLGKAYKFTLKDPTVLWMDVQVAPKGSAQCRLYKIDAETSFAIEYYIGHVLDNHCSMRVSLSGGDYQMEVSPEEMDDMNFTLMTKKTTGDGNDGFREANTLIKNSVQTGYLEDADHGEWYKFDLAAQQTLTVELSNTNDVRCLIYPLANVNLLGFSGPVCNEAYDYPAGTYYVGVMRRDERTGKATFTVRYK